jgi:hypothetical protein
VGAFCVYMATIVDTYIKDGETINVYESGAHYNLTRGHLIKAADSAMITPEKSKKYKEILAEKKREALARGAAKVLERTGDWETPNNLDMVEAIGEAVMLKALDPTNAKQVDAARFMLTETGLSESQVKSSDEAQQFANLADAAASLLAFLRGGNQAGDVMDGEARDVPELDSGDTDIRNDTEAE